MVTVKNLVLQLTNDESLVGEERIAAHVVVSNDSTKRSHILTKQGLPPNVKAAFTILVNHFQSTLDTQYP